MRPETNQGGEFISYPTNRVVGTIDDPVEAQAAIQELIDAGFSMDEIDVLYGEEGMRRLDPTGKEHGLLARLQRTLLNLNEEPKHLKQHFEDVLAGRFVIMVLAEEAEKRERVKEILESHGGYFINFYGRWAMQSLAGNERAQAEPAWYAGALPANQTYKADFQESSLHLRFESDTMMIITDPLKGRSETVPITTTPIIRKGVFMISWQERDATRVVSVWDFENEMMYTDIIRAEGAILRNVGTLKTLR